MDIPTPTTPIQIASNTPSVGDSPNRLQSACEAFEAIFARQILNSASLYHADAGPFGTAPGSATVRNMCSTHLAEAIGRTRGLGIAPMLLHHLAQNAPPPPGPHAQNTTSRAPGLTPLHKQQAHATPERAIQRFIAIREMPRHPIPLDRASHADHAFSRRASHERAD